MNSFSSDLNCTNNHRGLCTIQPHRFNVESAGKSACLAAMATLVVLAFMGEASAQGRPRVCRSAC
jgi:hypothetical protein